MIRRYASYAVLSAGLIPPLLPFYWMVVTSLEPATRRFQRDAAVAAGTSGLGQLPPGLDRRALRPFFRQQPDRHGAHRRPATLTGFACGLRTVALRIPRPARHLLDRRRRAHRSVAVTFIANFMTLAHFGWLQHLCRTRGTLRGERLRDVSPAPGIRRRPAPARRRRPARRLQRPRLSLAHPVAAFTPDRPRFRASRGRRALETTTFGP